MNKSILEIRDPSGKSRRLLMTGEPEKVKAALIASRQRTGSWADTTDEVASAIAEIGRRWEAGACLIFEEHAATEALRRAAAACVGEMHQAKDAPRAALFTIENERHTLGLALAELVVAEAGWRPLWIGEGLPADEIETLVTKATPRMLVVSASLASPRKAVSRYQDVLSKVTEKQGVRLILAGGGSWLDSADATRVLSFKSLRAALTG